MLYREVGQYKTTYEADHAIFPLLQDRVGIAVILAIAFLAVPFIASDFVLNSMLIPILIFALAAIGLNLLTGYAGLISLGTAFPQVNILVPILLSGFFSAAVGVLFGLPSLRIKGFYLAVATLASQFFLEWAFARVKWFTDYAPSGSVAVGRIELFGISIDTPAKTYIFVLAMTVVLALAAKNLVRGRLGRM